MSDRRLRVRRLGRLEYGAALALQKETARRALSKDEPDTVPLGRGAKPGGILMPKDVIEERGVTVFETNRGGKVTYHGLGQLVGYPIINLSPEREAVHRYVRDLEEVLMRSVADFGIESFRIKGLTGVHTAAGKVAAIGVHIARWVTTHGFALNIDTDLSFFNLIIACEGEPVTSMKELLGRELQMREVEDSIIARFADVFEMRLEEDEQARTKAAPEKPEGYITTLI